MQAIPLIFWLCIGLVIYSYALYPVLLLAIYPFTRQPNWPAGADAPSVRVAVLVSAYNEEAHIKARVENLLSQEYPPELLTIYVGSDGSTDKTNAILRSISNARVKSFLYDVNRGKANVVNSLLESISEPVVVFTDANTEFSPDAIRKLTEPFADPSIGCVCGELKILGASGENQDSTLWRAEQFLKVAESGIGGLLGANGGIYAIRRGLYVPLEADAIIDDFQISMAVLAQGYRSVYRRDAIAIEDSPPSIADEFRRRIRIGIGNYQALFRHPEYFLRTTLATKFTYVSHKVLRWMTPVLLLAALAANCALIRVPLYAGLLVLQVSGYALCFLMYSLRNRIKLPKLIALPVQLVMLNYAFLVALQAFIRGNYKATWRRTER